MWCLKNGIVYSYYGLTENLYLNICQVRMAKNNGWAEVRPSQFGFQVIINHFTGAPEIWDKFSTEHRAVEETLLWNSGLWGEGFTLSAEGLRLKSKDDKSN
jgi:hypothetical protein